MKMDLRTIPWLAIVVLLTIVAAGEFFYVLRAGLALGEALKNTRLANQAVREASVQYGLMSGEKLRLEVIVHFSEMYQIPADLAGMIYDAAIAQAIDPVVAFQLVDVESAFNCRAISRKGAIGCTQVMPSTGRSLDPHMTVADLFKPQYNLHLGFSYLGILLEEYEGDLRLALLAYNRGPSRVDQLLAMGEDPANGYAEAVCRGIDQMYRPCLGE